MKSRFLFFAAIMVLLIGCSSDSDSSSLPITEANMVGKWHYTGKTIDNGAFQNEENLCSVTKDYYEILNSHNLNAVDYASDCTIAFSSSATWTLEGNTFTTVSPDPTVYPSIYKVVKLTDSKLVMRRDFHPISPSQTEVYNYYFTRD